jgi:hypothetical protein
MMRRKIIVVVRMNIAFGKSLDDDVTQISKVSKLNRNLSF